MTEEEIKQAKMSRYDVPKFEQIKDILGIDGWFVSDRVVSGEKKIKILDYGCNAGTFARWIRDKYPILEVYGTDLDKSAIDVAREIEASDKPENPVNYYYLDELQGQYDIMTIMEVVEHLPDPERYFRNLVDAHLKDGGHLIISTPRETFPQGLHISPHDNDKIFNFMWYYLGTDKVEMKYAATDNTIIAHCVIDRTKRTL